MTAIRQRLLVSLGVGFVILATAVVFDVQTPASVAWRPHDLQGYQSERADGLVLQHETASAVFATQGYSIYRSTEGGPFERIFTLRVPIGEAWGGYSKVLRSWFGYQELVEVLPLNPTVLLAFAGGEVARIDLQHGTQEPVHRLRYFGRGEGRGVMAHGLAITSSGTVFYGEYPTAPGRDLRTIRLWRATDEGRRWEVAYEFSAGEVRHIHAVQWDPYDHGIWIGTGDRDEGSRLGVSHDDGRSFHWVGQGSQDYRLCSLLFLKSSIGWGMDADRSPAYVLRWRRSNRSVEPRAGRLAGPAFYSSAVGPSLGLIGLAEHAAAVWMLGERGEPVPWLEWTLPNPPRRGPHPGVRLTRGDSAGRPFVYLNPLRTQEDEAVIYRIRSAAVVAIAAERMADRPESPIAGAGFGHGRPQRLQWLRLGPSAGTLPDGLGSYAPGRIDRYIHSESLGAPFWRGPERPMVYEGICLECSWP